MVRDHRAAFVIAAYVAFAIAVFAARPPATSGPLARDFEAYWSAGSAFDRHADPYSAAIWNDERAVPGVAALREELLPFVGPPATLVLWSMVARMPYAVAAACWLIVLCCALGGLLLVCLRGARAEPNLLNGLAAIAFAISFGPITSDLALGQFALVAVFGACVLIVTPRMVPATIGCVLALAQPNVALALLSQLARKRRVIAIAAAAVVSYLLGAVALGWNWIARYATVLQAHAAAEHFSAIQITPSAIAYGLGLPEPAASLIGVVLAAGAVVCAVAIARRTGDAFARFAGFAALTPFVSAFWHEHDFVVAFPAAIWCARRAAAPVRAIAFGGALLVAIDWLGLAQRPGGIAQSALLAGGAWCAYRALEVTTSAKPAYYAGAVVGLLFIGAAALAAAHPAPVWPDAMHAVAVSRETSAAQVWAAEQRATGLDRPVASWAILRAFSLLGCALLAGAIYSRSTYYRTA